MKTIFQFCAVAIISLAVISCQKSNLSEFSVAPPNTDPMIYSKISKQIVQPAAMELGSQSAVIHEGETVTIFLPYTAKNESFVSATIKMTDALTGETINTYDMVPSADESASQLQLPDELLDHPEFFFITFVANENYTGRSVSISTNLTGQVTSSTDEVVSAFSVVH